MLRSIVLAFTVALPTTFLAQNLMAQDQSGHMMHSGQMQSGAAAMDGSAMENSAVHGSAVHGPAPALREGGQAAFAAIQEITAALVADPATDWSKVDIEALRQHLIDMDNVTLRASVISENIDGGARFTVTSADPAVMSSIRAMTMAHVATMNGVEGWDMQAREVDGGAVMTVTGPDIARIRGLGYIGLMTVGMHHQTHHLALASGQNPHTQ